MKASTITFSAEFGGEDACEALLPHFKMLKIAAKGIRLEGFPFAQLAYILRVAGEVKQYRLVGPGDGEIGRRGEYLSIDLGIRREDRADVAVFICKALVDSVEYINRLQEQRTWKRHGWILDLNALRRAVYELVTNYRKELTKAESSPPRDPEGGRRPPE